MKKLKWITIKKTIDISEMEYGSYAVVYSPNSESHGSLIIRNALGDRWVNLHDGDGWGKYVNPSGIPVIPIKSVNITYTL